MKRLITAFALLILVISFGLIGMCQTSKICESLQTTSDEIKEHIENDEMDIAKEKVEEFEEKWTNQEKILRVFLRRNNLDEISKQMYGLKGWIEVDDETEATAALTVINNIAKDTVEIELPTLRNIL